MLHRLDIRPRVCFQNYSLSRLRCSRVASTYGWVIILLYFLSLNDHTYYFSNRLWDHTIFGHSNHCKINVEDISQL
jgi:hypothetical protein